MAWCALPHIKEAPVEWVLDINDRLLRMIIPCVAVAFLSQTASGIMVGNTDASIVLGTGGTLSVVAVIVRRLAKHYSCRPRVQMGILLAWLTMVMVVIQCASPFIGDFAYRTRYHAGSMFILKPLPASLGLPVGAAGGILLVSCLMDFLTYVLQSIRFGDLMEMRVYLSGLCATLFWFGVAWSSSRQMGILFDYKVALAAEKALMESIIRMMCDGIIWLSEDGDIILGTDRRVEVALGKVVIDEDVSEVVSRDEQERFKEGLKRAKTEPVLLPTTLVTANGVKVPVDLFIAGNRNIKGHEVGAKPTPAFLIGIRFAGKPDALDMLPEPPAGSSHSILQVNSNSNSKLGEYGEDPDGLNEWCLGAEADAVASEAAPNARLGEDDNCSMPTTTLTGKLFQGVNVDRLPEAEEAVDAATEMSASLARISALGLSEGWLIKSEDLQVSPSQPLGAGAFGEVMRGTLHGSPIAAKTTRLDAEGSVSVEHLAALANEIRILRHTKHPNVVLFRGAYIGASTFEVILVTEMVFGCDLFEYVLSLPMGGEPRKRWQMLLDVSSALWYLHAQHPQVIHGDLKGANILVEPGIPRAKLLDFGLARIRTKGAEPLGGSLRWMAPEVVCGHGQPNAHADAFSFGRVAYMVITSRKPLNGLTREAIIAGAKRGIFQALSWKDDVPLHSEGARLCDKVLKIDPQQRPNMGQVHQEIETWAPPQASARKEEAERALMEDAERTPVTAAPSTTAPSTTTQTPGSARRAGTMGWLQGFLSARKSTQRPASPRAVPDAPAAVVAADVQGAAAAVPVAAVAVEAAEAAEAAHAVAAVPAATALPEQVPDQGSGDAKVTLAVPEGRPTSDNVARMLVMETASRMNFPCRPNVCCKLHAAMDELLRLTRELRDGPCWVQFKPANGYQCPACGILDTDVSQACSMCNHIVSTPGGALQPVSEECRQDADGHAAHLQSL